MQSRAIHRHVNIRNRQNEENVHSIEPLAYKERESAPLKRPKLNWKFTLASLFLLIRLTLNRELTTHQWIWLKKKQEILWFKSMLRKFCRMVHGGKRAPCVIYYCTSAWRRMPSPVRVIACCTKDACRGLLLFYQLWRENTFDFYQVMPQFHIWYHINATGKPVMVIFMVIM